MTENGKIFVTELTVNNCPRKLRNSSIMKTSNISQGLQTVNVNCNISYIILAYRHDRHISVLLCLARAKLQLKYQVISHRFYLQIDQAMPSTSC